MTTILWTIGLIALAVLLLSVGVILRKDKQFRSQHLSQSPAMRKRNIGCVMSEDRKTRRSAARKMNIDKQ